ncbi:MAG: hypothetical protein A2469_02205 [Candidatus Magasanikbacteria bacterium RIFOXYC2_FULL_40_16]|uniref:Glycosyltransferase 2-like domain-containing protein n=2 Tax=Candidatus Magasanikiibacteriota TaxID=1752731 RepID=A0A1F6P1B3_9BACT|nr:MAG: hypothetical protein A2224_01675 [Candidatus Magasanikbacteria bacterium RIFOXYA2_FULL_40_20]OGH86080.1 MAG: hypothetical protein A2301_02725 [Candidatus Magasanikbacteria bacterium RIFOXYB2_FULL_40_13]OGH87930.1 MAG: hypothetical protein A2206_03475 [Candidatus Magasanikbacteria bacterium RIFOXYA1_FULL_40_8]OGH89955.1 MAG: hypothetical protein A2469_02205 [Candidatus Magasanikbacteria bacterium RIFOXYC2_FULL_40_16]
MLIAIIPAYNEEKKIGSVVRDLLNHADKVLVVDDGSKDRTGAVAKEAGAMVLTHRINRGQGAALQTGHEYAKKLGADFVLHFDGDGQFDVSDIAPALEKIKSTGADILFGSRFLSKESNIPFIKKYLLFPLARVFNRFFTRIKLTDTHNGFRILNRRALEQISIKQDRMAHATEIISQVKEKGLKYVEFPVKVVYCEYGQGLLGGLQIFKDLILGRFIRK